MPVPAGTPIVRGFIPGAHLGIDYGVPVGTPVQATASGTVTQADNTDPRGYGCEIDIDHGGGWSSRYGHLVQYAVAQGQTVQQGAVIGYSGGQQGAPCSGNATGPHLHFEIAQGGVQQDPAPLVGGNAVGRLTASIGPVPIPDPTDPLTFLDPALSGTPLDGLDLGDLLSPIEKLVAQLPAQTFKVLTGGHSVTEIAIRTVELIGGGVLLLVAGVLLVKIAVTGTPPEQAAATVRRTVRRAPRRRAASTRRPARPVGRQPAPGARTMTREQNRAQRPSGPRRPRRGAPRRELVSGSDVELVV